MSDDSPFAPPQTAELSEPDNRVLSAAWQFGVPKVRRVFYVIAALYGFGAVMGMAASQQQSLLIVAALLQVGIAGVHLGLAALSGRRPMLATKIGIGLFVLFNVLPALIQPEVLLVGVFGKVLSIVLLIFGFRSAKTLELQPRLVHDD